MSRIIYLCIGWFSVGCGTVGALLPIMPTVPFLLVAVWAFSRSSDHLHERLLSHPVFGPDIRRWQERGAIRRPAKILSVLTMAGSIMIAWLLGSPPQIVAVQATILGLVAIYIATRPED